ncbi:hypothetical protein GCM10007160_43390 [Litchfieldella qijiaojingensis]|uniref:Alpha-L-glutamate ligase-related protein ATP-grasp domain-containing protein n=2 Tax=Litchfieldella qijiaojingensis TaxID=980347 RepID=A0ABQ2ZFG5_9GAMM|nr:hypothetical protein GCM10007160_43390 [Halomonas qijiaojingensis]
MDLSCEYARLQYGRGKLTLPEYVRYGVYETDLHSREDQARFITNKLHWPIVRKCFDMSWQAATEDKWLCSHTLAHSEIKIPETLAVIDKTDRAYPGTHKISTAESLRDFFNSQDVLPCFAKENRGICSFGAFLVLDADRDKVNLKGEGWLDYETCMNQFIGDTPYLVQKLQRNHSFFDQYTENLATVRVYVLVTERGISTPFACLKLPSRDNVADSFWRPGNLACDLDPKTGEILTIRSQHRVGISDHAEHPETGKSILGETVPLWGRVMDLVHSCASIFYQVKYQSMDIAVTQDGPVLIEINTGGGFDLPQLASGRGFLTDEVCELFRSCGYRKL